MLRSTLLIALVPLVFSCTMAPRNGAADSPVYQTLPERAALNLPYSDAVRIGELLFLSGTVGSVPGTRHVIPGGVAAETRQALENIKANLEAHGSSLDHVVKCTVML